MSAFERRLAKLEEAANIATSRSAIDCIELVEVCPVPGKFGGEVGRVVRYWPIGFERGQYHESENAP